MATIDELRDASDALRRIDERRSGQLAYRDFLIRKTLAEGATWDQVMVATGLSRRAVQQAIRRQ